MKYRFVMFVDTMWCLGRNVLGAVISKTAVESLSTNEGVRKMDDDDAWLGRASERLASRGKMKGTSL